MDWNTEHKIDVCLTIPKKIWDTYRRRKKTGISGTQSRQLFEDLVNFGGFKIKEGEE